MILLSHFPVVGVSNTYVIGPSEGGSAILVDPGRFDTTLLEMLEDRDLYVDTVLVTHAHDNHISGLRTLMKIYQATIYSGSEQILGFPSMLLNHGDSIELCGFQTQVLSIGGHTPDSRVFRIADFLFTGDVLSAGRLGTTETSWEQDNMKKDIQDHLFSLGDHLILLPGHGPPTTVESERLYNPA